MLSLVTVLYQLKSSITSEDSTDTEDASLSEVEFDKVDITHEWLMRQMPQLPHFKLFASQAGVVIQQTCQIEIDPVNVSAYIQYLSKYAPDDQLQDLDKEAHTWSDIPDQILVEWSTGEAATRHILVVQAMFMLFTYGKLPGKANFNELLEIWFPEHGTQPAFLVDTTEEALLLPDWLRLCMMQLSVPQLVDTALKELDPSQLVPFVQPFGSPLCNTSKLLQHLDAVVELDKFVVKKAVMNKNYMAQIVEVQKLREANDGDRFQSILKDTKEEWPEPVDAELDIVDEMDADELQKFISRTSLLSRLINLTDIPTVVSILMKLFLGHGDIKEKQRLCRIVEKEFCQAIFRNEGSIGTYNARSLILYSANI